MKGKIVQSKNKRDVEFVIMDGMLYGTFYGSKKYKCIDDLKTELKFEGIENGAKQKITIKKSEFEKIKHQLIIK